MDRQEFPVQRNRTFIRSDFLCQAIFLEREAAAGLQDVELEDPRLQQFSVRNDTSEFMFCMLAL
jgi:hypothetical protein